MKKILTLTLSSLLIIPTLTHAEFKGGFADIGLHYLDWTSDTTEKTSKKSHKDDFGYLELEGGANFSWGEMYGFSTGKIFTMAATLNPAANSVTPLKILTVFIWAIQD